MMQNIQPDEFYADRSSESADILPGFHVALSETGHQEFMSSPKLRQLCPCITHFPATR
jgi:hypothetical protein